MAVLPDDRHYLAATEAIRELCREIDSARASIRGALKEMILEAHRAGVLTHEETAKGIDALGIGMG